MRVAVRCTIAAAVIAAAACGTAAQAQSRSRVDLEFGSFRTAGEPGLALGVTAWLNDRSGVAVRGIYWPGTHEERDWKGFETQYHHRGFIGDFEFDYGIGLMFLTAEEPPHPSRPTLRRTRTDVGETLEVLVGRRFLDRFGVKAGLGCYSAILSGIPAAALMAKFMVVVPL